MKKYTQFLKFHSSAIQLFSSCKENITQSTIILIGVGIAASVLNIYSYRRFIDFLIQEVVKRNTQKCYKYFLLRCFYSKYLNIIVLHIFYIKLHTGKF